MSPVDLLRTTSRISRVGLVWIFVKRFLVSSLKMGVMV